MIFSSIPEEDVFILSEQRKKDTVFIEVMIRNRGNRCKKCGTYHETVKEYILKRIPHQIYHGKECVLLYRHRRFICPKCGKTQMEENPFCSPGKHISDETVRNVLDFLKRYNNTFRSAAEYFHLSVTQVMKIFDRYVKMERNPLTKVVCFDEIYFSRKRKKKYVLVLIGFFNRCVLDILRDRDKSTLSSYLRRIDAKERERVLYASIDMNANYREVLLRWLPNARIVADSFHVVRRVSKALDDVRKRIMRRYEKDRRSDEYYMLKYRDELLYLKDPLSDEHRKVRHNHHFHYVLSEFELLEKMKKIDPELSLSYEFYHRYIRFNGRKEKDREKLAAELDDIILDYRCSGIREFEELSLTLREWRAEILNSFSEIEGRRVSNGPIEGRNSLIRKILKLANGYSNFDRFRNRILYSLNKLARHSF